MSSVVRMSYRPLAFARAASTLLIALALISPSGGARAQVAQAQQHPQLRLITGPVSDPRQPGVQWFSRTGHTLRGAFLDYWARYGGLPQFGYPITEEFVEPAGATGKQPLVVQYFERNRFEHHPENANTPFEVLLGNLGLDFHDSDPAAAPVRSPNTEYFGPTGHNVAGPFLSYWHTHGGLFVHGYPVTEAYYEQKNPTNGKSYLVQYFERSRFEYHPENAGTPYEVLLGLLGDQLSQKKGYPYGWYPLYGHAADFSWVAGVYEPDPRQCADCSCNTVHYLEGSWFFAKDASVHPVGPIWKGAETTRQTYGSIVIFGQVFSSALDGAGCPTYLPNYHVDALQANPIP
jgi:hypothetical protein